MKEKLLVVFGGKSVEHDISIITAVQAMKNLPEKYVALPVYIDKNGIWWSGENLDDISIYKNFSKLARKKRQVTFLLGENVMLLKKGTKWIKSEKIFATLNCCHGNLGEDGSIQGVFRCCDLPQSCCDVTASAVCMDKAFMKDVLVAHDIKTPEYVVLKKHNLAEEGKIEKFKFKFPVIVKPANLGSSIGISLCKNSEELKAGISLAFEFDEKIIVEKVVENLREFNCACFMFQNNLFASNVCEVTNKSEIFSFEDKYLSSANKTKNVSKKIQKQVKALTEKAYEILDCEGIVRIDFLYDEQKEILYVNEVNSIPGSLAFYLYKDTKFSNLLDVVIQQSKINFARKQKLVKTFESDAIEIFNNSLQGLKK